MRPLILLLGIVFFSGCMGEKAPKKMNAFESQLSNEQLEVKKAMDLYIEQLKSLNADNIIKMTYPKLFIPINKEKFRDYLHNMFTSCDLGIQSFDANVTHIHKIKTFPNGQFTQIEYKSTIIIHFLNPALYDTEYKILVLNKMLAAKYGQKNIKVNTKERTITIRKREKILAIKEHHRRWKFIGDNSEYRRLYPKFLPKEILNHI